MSSPSGDKILSLPHVTAAEILDTDTLPVVVDGITSRTEVSEFRKTLAYSKSAFNVVGYGAKGDGTTNDTAAILAALVDARLVGGVVFFPPGDYPTDQISLNVDGMMLLGSGRATILRARANNSTVINLAASYCRISDIRIDSGSFTGVTGIRLAPSNEAASGAVHSDYNAIENIFIADCANGISLGVGGDASSSCFYNEFRNIQLYRTLRGVWLRAAFNGGASGPNRNQFYSVRCGQTPINTGIQIDAGDTCTFYGCSFEGIAAGTSPNATPTGLIVSASAPNNRFYGCTWEGNTRDVENNVGNTEFYGPLWTGSKVAGISPFGGVQISSDASQADLRLPGLVDTASRWQLTRPLMDAAPVVLSLTNAVAQTVRDFTSFPNDSTWLVTASLTDGHQEGRLYKDTSGNLYYSSIVDRAGYLTFSISGQLLRITSSPVGTFSFKCTFLRVA